MRWTVWTPDTAPAVKIGEGRRDLIAYTARDYFADTPERAWTVGEARARGYQIAADLTSTPTGWSLEDALSQKWVAAVVVSTVMLDDHARWQALLAAAWLPAQRRVALLVDGPARPYVSGGVWGAPCWRGAGWDWGQP